jgi:hypothetical protein
MCPDAGFATAARSSEYAARGNLSVKQLTLETTDSSRKVREVYGLLQQPRKLWYQM